MAKKKSKKPVLLTSVTGAATVTIDVFEELNSVNQLCSELSTEGWDGLISMKDAAELMGVEVAQINYYERQGVVPRNNTGREKRFTPAAVLALWAVVSTRSAIGCKVEPLKGFITSAQSLFVGKAA